MKFLRALFLGMWGVVAATQAAEIGHFVPGLMSLRDYAVPPDPGFYGVIYNYGYSTDRLNDPQGNQVDSVTLNPRGGPGVTLDVDVDVDVYAIAPVFIWVSEAKVFGARYAAYVVPNFANASVGAALSAESGRGVHPDTSQFAMGDVYVQPLWLGWSLSNWDFAFGYGFYAPIGEYNTETVELPGDASLRAESVDNIGLGFWTHQAQGAVSWYPWADKRMAVLGALTYEINGEKEDFDLTPGDVLTFNWGISQYLPLKKDHTLLLEIGPAGYSSWQVTDDTGSDVRDSSIHDEVHAAGGQLGLTHVPWLMSVNLHGFHEFSAEDRFEGTSYGLNIAKKF